MPEALLDSPGDGISGVAGRIKHRQRPPPTNTSPTKAMMKTLAARFLSLAILLSFAPAAGSATIIYAATANGLLFRSADAAKTWQPVSVAGAPVPAAQPALAVDPQNSSILYLVLRAGDRVQPGGNTGGIYRSADGGVTWSQPASPSTGPSRLAVDPTSSNIVYLGVANAGTGGFFRSTDSGTTWSAPILTDLIYRHRDRSPPARRCLCRHESRRYLQERRFRCDLDDANE
jgi:hypothetical protein